MAGYAQIRGGLLWYHPEVERLSDEAFRLLIFCFSGPGRTMVGVRRYSHSDPLGRIPDWTEERAARALKELITAGLVVYDSKERMLYLRQQFEHAPVKGVKQLQGAARVLADLPRSWVMEEPLRHLEAACLEALEQPPSEGARGALVACLKAFRAKLRQICQESSSPDTLSIGYPAQGATKMSDVRNPTQQHEMSTTSGMSTPSTHEKNRVSEFADFAEFALQEQEQEQDTPPTPPTRSRRRGKVVNLDDRFKGFDPE